MCQITAVRLFTLVIIVTDESARDYITHWA